MLCGKKLALWPWPMTLKINRVPDWINILQWILTKLGTYLVLRRVWNPIDFQGHRSKVNVTRSNFYRVTSLWILECSQGCYAVKIWPSDLDLWPWKSIGFQILLRTKYVPRLVKIHWRMLILVFTRMWRIVLNRLNWNLKRLHDKMVRGYPPPPPEFFFHLHSKWCILRHF
jgi:hypothetical protein